MRMRTMVPHVAKPTIRWVTHEFRALHTFPFHSCLWQWGTSTPELLLPASRFSHRTISYKIHFPFPSSLYLCCFLSHRSDPQV